jgi:hypothetical protein
VALSSADGYLMSYPGGSLTSAAQTVRYSTRLVGPAVDKTTPAFTTTACSSAGTGGQYLPITVTLEEGGAAKAPSPSYQDTLTVTVTPLAVPYNGTTLNCQSLQ